MGSEIYVRDRRGDICELDDIVAELETFRKRLAEAFGTGMDGDPVASDNSDIDGAE